MAHEEKLKICVQSESRKMDHQSELYKKFVAYRGGAEVLDEEEEKSCSICFDDLTSANALTMPCCGGIICLECFRRMLTAATDTTCFGSGCGEPVDLEQFDAHLTEELRLKFLKINARDKLGGWINCGDTRCNGGAAGAAAKDKNVKCVVCKLDYCSYCTELNAGRRVYHPGESCDAYQKATACSSSGSAPVLTIEMSLDDEIAWSGAVKCPNCSQPVQRDGGCSLLTCPKCGLQFQADGTRGKEHTSRIDPFDRALGKFNDRSKADDIDWFLAEFNDIANVFSLPKLIGRIRAASEAGDGGAVGEYLSVLSRNPVFLGLVDCLRALYTPLERAAEAFYDHLRTVNNVEGVRAALQNPQFVGAYDAAKMSNDEEALAAVVELGRDANPAFLLRHVNKIKDANVKKKVKSLLPP